MRYWWVYQNQTFRHEIAGGYPTFKPGNMRLWLPTNAINGEAAPRRYILWPPGITD
jgi:hypothetical protein